LDEAGKRSPLLPVPGNYEFGVERGDMQCNGDYRHLKS